MLRTNTQFLHAEIMDVIRLFNAEDREFTHYFSYGNGEYRNCIEYGDKFYDSSDVMETESEVEYKRYAKRFAKLAFYNLLSTLTGVEMPYGALTGVRPTKLAYMEQAEDRDFRELFAKLKVSSANISLTERILQSQRDCPQSVGGRNLFVSLPFCPTKCEYCSFITAPISATRGYVENYVGSLVKEIESAREILTDARSIYIGGGTPFTVDERQLGRIYGAINALNLKNCEYTVEAGRPDTFTEEKLKLSKDFGVNRICVNPQTFNDETLKRIGRRHTSADTFNAYAMAEKYGFDINIDLIAGLTDETLDDFADSLGKAIGLNPSNITVHVLSLKSGARLKESCNRLFVKDVGAMIALSREELTKAGYRPYYAYRQKYQAGGHENCGWAKAGKECVYNIGVMEEVGDVVAVGANAISKRVFKDEERIVRCASPKDVPTYISKSDKIIEERNKLFGGV